MVLRGGLWVSALPLIAVPSLTPLCTMEPSDYSSEIQEDWTNRENSETICTSLKTVVEFLNRFHSSCRTRLAEMDNRLKTLERKMDRLDAHTAYNVTIQEQIRRNAAT
ncbi:putative protein BRICK1-B [Echinococcus granulosus]|uniref:Expressed protein n=1 Tax=Echinococcus granulosus TaxID=6210 RepID=A0A068WCX6_ECHGR|nr:putative protein BRICK1-B [Echinococcus granulosus]CDS17940.1 expressed protein [Echinococcus granulosus]